MPAVSPKMRSGELVRAAGAATVIVGIVIGFPVLLALALGSPIQRGDGAGSVVRAIVSLLLWAAWAHFTACLAAEWRAERRGSGLAPRIPFGGAPQEVARRLVVTSLLFSGTTALVAPVTYGHSPATPTGAGDTRAFRAMAASTAPGLTGPRPDPDGLRSTAGPGEGPAVRETGQPDGSPWSGPPSQAPREPVAQAWPPDIEMGADAARLPAPPVRRVGAIYLDDDQGGGEGQHPAGWGSPEVEPSHETSPPHPRGSRFDASSGWYADRPELISPIADPNSRLMPGNRTVKLYEVRPAGGRHHDTLWGIAERFLGDGLRYREIFDLNEGRAQPDGRTLSKPSLIHAGWVLLLPADAQGDGLRVVQVPGADRDWPDPFQSGATDPAGTRPDGIDGRHEPQATPSSPIWPSFRGSESVGRGDQAPASARVDQIDAGRSTPIDGDPDLPDLHDDDERDAGDDRAPAGSTSASPHAPAGPAPAGQPPTQLSRHAVLAADQPATPEHDALSLLRWSAPGTGPLGIAAAGLLAAGVLAALSARRSGPAGPPQDETERALLLAADTEAARFIDQSLRTLADGLAATGRLLPPVYAAILTDDELLLYMAPAEPDAPPVPWSDGGTPGSWRIERISGHSAGPVDDLPARLVSRSASNAPAPFPALVSFGRDDTGSRVLVDLEGAPGIISLVGDLDVAAEVAIAVALELATNMWSDDLRVGLVGFPAGTEVDELTAIAPNRLWVADDLASVLDDLADPVSGDTGRSAGHGINTTGWSRTRTAGRPAGDGPQATTPDLIILAGPPPDTDVARLARLAGGRENAVGVLTVGDTTATRWRFTVGADRRMSLGVLGVEVWAHALDVAEYTAISTLFHRADTPGISRQLTGTVPDAGPGPVGPPGLPIPPTPPQLPPPPPGETPHRHPTGAGGHRGGTAGANQAARLASAPPAPPHASVDTGAPPVAPVRPTTPRSDEPTRPPARPGSVPGAVPWVPGTAAHSPSRPLAPPGPADGTRSSDAGSPSGGSPRKQRPAAGSGGTIDAAVRTGSSTADDDRTRPPAKGRRLPAGPPPPPSGLPAAVPSPTSRRAPTPPGAAPAGTPAPGAPDPGRTPSVPTPPIVGRDRRPPASRPHPPGTPVGTDDADGPDSGLLTHPGRPLIRPTDLPQLPPGLPFDTSPIPADRQVDAEPVRPLGGVGTDDRPAAAGSTTAGLGRAPARPPVPPPNERPAPPVKPPSPDDPSLPGSPPDRLSAIPGSTASWTRPGLDGEPDLYAPPQRSAPARYTDGEPTIPDGGAAGATRPGASTTTPPPPPPQASPGVRAASAGSPPTGAGITGGPVGARAFGSSIGNTVAPFHDPPPTGDAQVRILGAPTVEGPGGPAADHVDLLTEVIIYLALHREGAHSRLLSEEIRTSDTDGDLTETTLAEAHRWLGTDAAGQPRVTLDDGVWRLSPDVRCDWELFVAYTHHAGLAGSDTEADLTTALRMVGGPLWTDLPAGRYRWATTGPIARSTRAGVVDVAHQLARLTLDFGDTMTAMAACRTGLRAVPSSEVLWRDLLQTVAARGDRRTLQAVATEMYRTIGAGGTRRSGRAEAETEALVQALLPGFRRNRR